MEMWITQAHKLSLNFQAYLIKRRGDYMLRIIEKKTHLFIRDDFTYDESEYGLNVEPAQGLYKPKWYGDITEDEEGNVTVSKGEWIEGATQEEIDELTKPQPHEPTIEERLEQTEQLLQATTMAFTEFVFMQGMGNDS